MEADVAALHRVRECPLVEEVDPHGLGSRRAQCLRGPVGARERHDVVAAIAQRRDERAAQQARPTGDERARQGALWTVGCARRGAGADSGASTGTGGASSGTSRNSDPKLRR